MSTTEQAVEQSEAPALPGMPTPAPRRVSPLQDAVERLGDYVATGIEPTGDMRDMIGRVLHAFTGCSAHAQHLTTAGRDALDAIDRLTISGPARSVEAYGVLVAELRDALR